MPISRVRCVTDTSTVFVTTTMAASSAISEMGPAAAPIRCDRFATKPRAASGASTSKLSETPGPSARIARNETRRVIFGVLGRDAAAARGEHLHGSRRAERAFERAQRDPHVLILRAAAATDAALHANDFESPAGEPDGLTDGRARWEQRRHHIGADHRHRRAGGIFAGREEASGHQIQIPNVGESRRGAGHRRILEYPAATHDIGSNLCVWRVVRDLGRVARQRCGFRAPNRRIASELIL